MVTPKTILIIGAGPTGLMLANQLSSWNIPFRLIDKNLKPSLYSRALGVQARTLEIYDQLGLAKKAIERGVVVQAGNLFFNSEKPVQIPLGIMGLGLSPFPFTLFLSQDENETLLRERLEERGGKVEWGVALETLENVEGGVNVTLKHSEGTIEQIKADYVFGADGAHSRVRDLLQVDFEGGTYPDHFFVVNITATGKIKPNEINILLSNHDFHLLFPLTGEHHFRLIGLVPKELHGKENIGFEMIRPFVERATNNEWRINSFDQFSTYDCHYRVAKKFRIGNCFLLGDAAHVHSPVGAQGMNTGLQDATNIGWKLAQVVRGEAPDSLLNSYEAERLPNARKLIKSTDQFFKIIISKSWWAHFARRILFYWILPNALKVKFFRTRGFVLVSQIAISYRHSPIVKNTLPRSTKVQAGDRMPWVHLSDGSSIFEKISNRQFQAFVLGDVSDAEKQALDCLNMPVYFLGHDHDGARFGIPERVVMIVRPDGMIAFSCGCEPSCLESLQRTYRKIS